MKALTREQIGEALRVLGLRAGDIVFVHSSLSSMGYVEGGADAVVDALLDVLGPEGTLVVPTFTPSHGREAEPVFDALHDQSEVGKITEAVRVRPEARRSVHVYHSVAALGPRAQEITAIHGPSAWAADGPFWQLYELDARILLLGVPYLRSTYFHFPEQLVLAFYRTIGNVDARVRGPDGTERPLPTRPFRPKPGFGPDLNKFGVLLEEKGLVRAGAVGNAVARLFRARDVVEVGIAEYREDPLIFVRTGETYPTPLQDGVMIGDLDDEKSVWDPKLVYTRER